MLYAVALFTFIAGLLVGGLLFSDSKPRSLLSIFECGNCFAPNDVAGLFASVVVQNMPRLIPNVILETDKTIVFKHPRPRYRIHYIFVPKKDIKNILLQMHELYIDQELYKYVFKILSCWIVKHSFQRDRFLRTNFRGTPSKPKALRRVF